METPLDIRALRAQLDWSQEKLANYLGLDRSSVSRMERGQRLKGPTARLLAELAKQPKQTEAA